MIPALNRHGRLSPAGAMTHTRPTVLGPLMAPGHQVARAAAAAVAEAAMAGMADINLQCGWNALGDWPQNPVRNRQSLYGSLT